MIAGTTDLDLLVKYYEHLMHKAEQEPKSGAEFVYKLQLWNNIANTPFEKISQSQRLSYSYSYILLHCCFNLNHFAVPEEAHGLLQTMLVAFNRGGEDVSLAFR